MYRVIKASGEMSVFKQLLLKAAREYPDSIEASEVEDFFEYWSELEPSDMHKVKSCYNYFDDLKDELDNEGGDASLEREVAYAAEELGTALHAALSVIYRAE